MSVSGTEKERAKSSCPTYHIVSSISSNNTRALQSFFPISAAQHNDTNSLGTRYNKISSLTLMENWVKVYKVYLHIQNTMKQRVILK